MRVTLLKLLERMGRELDVPGPVYEFGAFRVPGQRHLPPVKSYFPGKAFVGTDLQDGPGVDEILDLHRLALPDASVGTALLFDTIEHVRDPWRALGEVRRCLVPGGLLFMTSHWYFPIHAYPDDYWRFTASAFRELLRDYSVISVDMFGFSRLPHTVIGVASNGPADPAIDRRLRDLVGEWGRRDSSTWKEAAMEFLPPRLLVPAYGAYLRMQEAAHRRNGKREGGEETPRTRA